MRNIDKFISRFITEREVSLFQEDINVNSQGLKSEIEGASVLVIGGAGTIGSSFIKALLPYKPAKLIVVDINENGLTELTRDLRSSPEMVVPKNYATYPFSYSDFVFEKMFRNHNGFDIVANFSAHKHVRSEKDLFSVEALLRNNVINAKKLLDIISLYPPKHFFCVSTDKAANPVNIMGASKKIMEDLIMTYKHRYKVTTARFANVAFSNGSLPAGFLERISKNQPLSAPSDVTRYFVSPEESGQICLLACILGKTGEIYFPKLNINQVITFSEIANKLLLEFGYEPEIANSEKEAILKSKKLTNDKYPVFYSKSNTTGEKPFEEFYTTDEEVDLVKHIGLGIVVNVKPKHKDEVDILITLLESAFQNIEVKKSDIIKIMKSFLVNFEHKETGKYLDSKM